MTDYTNAPINLPDVALDLATGRYVHASGLFSYFRDQDGRILVEAKGGIRSKLSAGDRVAAALAAAWQPDRNSVEEGSEEEALNEVHSYVRAWDMMLPGQVLATALAHFVFGEVRDENPTCALDHRVDNLEEFVAWSDGRWVQRFGACSLEPDQKGKLHLSVLGSEHQSQLSAELPEVRALLCHWDGFNGAASEAADFGLEGQDLAEALLTRWDRELAMMRQVWLRSAA